MGGLLGVVDGGALVGGGEVVDYGVHDGLDAFVSE